MAEPYWEGGELIKNMHLLDTTRIGYDQKQQHIDRLADLASNGYLTAEEYEARIEWLHNAKTLTDVQLVFKDLPKLTRPRPEPKKKKYQGSIQQAAAWFSVELAMTILGCTSSNMGMCFLFGVLTVLWGALLIYRIHTRER
jgi:hypothetical protein